MFKIAEVVSQGSFKEAKDLLERIRSESPHYWPYGLNADHFDAGLYLVREKQSNAAVGFCGFQIRHEFEDTDSKSAGRYRMVKTGFYSIGILPEYRKNHFAKEALQKLIQMKAASVDRVKAMIVQGNGPSMALARSLNVPVLVKEASRKSEDNYYAALRRVAIGSKIYVKNS